MKQTGQATVYGVGGTIAINGAAVLAAQIESLEGEDRATVEESMDGNGEIDGLRISDEREMLNITIAAKKLAAVGSLNDAKKALAYPPIPAKVVLAGCVESTGLELEINGDYIYTGGAQRSVVRGVAAFRMTVWRPKTSAFTIDQLLTVAT